MPYKFNFDLTNIPRKVFKEITIIVEKKKLHKKAGVILRRLIEKFKLSEITGLEISDLLLVLEDLVEIQIKNTLYREDFKKSRSRVLFLPHCARKYMDYRCRAEFNPDVPTYVCCTCSPDCQINIASRIALNLGYDVYIVPGSSCIPNILKKFSYDGVVGVACGEEIKLAAHYIEGRIPAQAIPLLKNGCSNTIFNLKSLVKILKS